MAVRLPNARTTFLSAVKEFPRWMSIRKRPEKAISGLFLQSVIEEQDDIIEEIKKFIKEFFLIYYDGKESKIADYVYIVQVGAIDYLTSELIKPVLDITIDPKIFLENINVYALYQGGYLIISSNNVPSDGNLLYSYNDYKYGGKLQRYHIWNIFDEFAMFLGLSRFADTGESNAQLLQRCFQVFQNPTNSTRKGLQNVIMNCLYNDMPIERDSVKIEFLDDSNAWLPYGDSTVYEHFVQLNKDIFRTKIWDSTWWEHNFKQLEYLSHVWDKTLDVYQDGTGQLQDLKVSLSQDEAETTKLTIQGFKRDILKINEYFRKQNFRNTISLQFLKYRDTLNPKHVEYKVTATPAVQIKTEEIQLREQVRVEGFNLLYIQDIISSEGYATVTNPGLLEKETEYKLVFKSDGDYSDMKINKIDLVDDGVIKNLMVENRTFKLKGDSLVHSDVKHHVTRIAELKSYDNLVDVIDGFTLGATKNEATFTLDITGCGGKTLKIASYCDMFNLLEQTDRWTIDGLEVRDGKLGSYTVVPDHGTATLDISCMGFSIELLKNKGVQGTVDVKVYVNEAINATLSTLMTDPDKPIEYWFDTLSNVKVIFTKSGSYPFEVIVKGTKYELTYSTTVGNVVQTDTFNYLSEVPDTTPNTLTVKVKTYDVQAPTIKYVHIGPSTSRRNYTVKSIIPNTDNAYLDIDSNCVVYLYKVINKEDILISDNFVTKKIYTNNTDDDIYLEINLQQFTEILSSSWTIHKTARYGRTVSYITLHPGDFISSMTINGVIYYDRALRTLDTLLGLDVTYNVYVAKNADGFIVRNPANGEEWLTHIERASLTEATIFSYENLPNGVTGVFVWDRPSNSHSSLNSTNRNFDETYLTTTSAEEHIMIDELDMYKATVGDVEDITMSLQMFRPMISANQMMFYKISSPVEHVDGSVINVVFKKVCHGKVNYFHMPQECRDKLETILTLIERDSLRSTIEDALADINTLYKYQLLYTDSLFDQVRELLYQGNWSLGSSKELCFSANFDFYNSDVFAVTKNTVDSAYILSSEIALPRTMSINNELIDICSYVITPPSYMKVVYGAEDDIIENGLKVKDDGFNKLRFSNVIEVIKVTINGFDYYDYDVLHDEGIIVWTKISDLRQLDDVDLSIAYKYKVPTGLVYTNLSYLYDKVGYNVDTMVPVELKTKLSDSYSNGDTFIVEWEDSIDYVPAILCSNPNFVASYNNGTVKVSQLYTDNVVLVKTGYYYDDDKEYYFYNHEHVEDVNFYNNVILHNVKRLDVIFQFMIATVNYVIHSDFKSGINYEKLCYVNFSDSFIESQGISQFNEITACDSYNMWQSYNMNVTFTSGLKDIGLFFTQEDNTGYAIMDITKYVIPDMLISVVVTEGLSLEIYREEKADEDVMVKTIFATPFDVFTAAETGIRSYTVPSDIDLTYRYFLLVRGNGLLDDMISRHKDLVVDQLSLHVKNIENFGFIVEEREEKGSLLKLAFEQTGCILDRLEITRDNKIQIGTNVDYGVTRIFDSSKQYDEITAAETIIRKKGTFITVDKAGWVKTPFFYVENHTNIADIYVKVNNLISGTMKNFNVKLRTATDEAGSHVKDLGYVHKTNLAHFDGANVNSYVQVIVDMDPVKVIDTMEIFARYGEIDSIPLIIQNNTEGSVITKVYDTVNVGSYRLKKIEGIFHDKAHITVSMRGCRQDNLYMVWTDWYVITLNTDLEAIFTPHIFSDYRLFQFKIDFANSNATAVIDNFVLEVV